MTTNKKLGLVLLLVFSISIVTTGYFNQAETIPATWEFVAPYLENIAIDGNLSDWDTITPVVMTLYNFSDSTNYFDIEAYFAYDDTYLYGAIVAPSTLGPVNGLDLMFFGKPDVADGIFIDCVSNFWLDLAHVDDGPPVEDTSVGGVDNLLGYGAQLANYSVIEFRKDRQSGDLEGMDFDLYYGCSIGVLTAAWVDKDTADEGGPNFGVAGPDNFNYLRLSIGEDTGEEIEVMMPQKFPWVIGEYWEAPNVDSAGFNPDGYADESFWAMASSYYIHLDPMPIENTSTLSINTVEEGKDGKISFIFDGDSIFIYLELADDGTEDEGDFTVFVLGEHDTFLEDPEGYDVVSIGSDFYMDGYMKPDMVEPEEDTMVGGTIDGGAGVTYTADYRRVEFYKPLTSVDYNGRDPNLYTGDELYIMILAGYNSSEGPNYAELHFEVDFFSFVIHPVYLMHKGEEGGRLPWEIVDEDYEAPYITESVTIDGYQNEAFWENVPSYNVKLVNIDWSTNDYGPDDPFDGTIKLACDGSYIYIFFEIYDETEDSGDMTIFAFSNSNEVFNDSYGLDIIMFNSTMYMDSYMTPDMNEPMEDMMNGGTTDGNAVVRYENNYRIIEFMKPINSGDSEGSDINVGVGDDLYFTILASFHETEDGPNYMQVVDIDGKPGFAIHTIHLLGEGEEPTGGNETSLTLGFGIGDLTIIGLSLATVMVLVNIRRKKY
ncbi:MAG: hypothetical protein ACTSPI_06415 [Candidatus Heimdallarchaeaceae archaeon]